MENKPGRGGPRTNSGRPRLTKELRQLRAAEKRQILVDELLYPSISAAFHCEPGRFGDRFLEVNLSKRQIELAYGRDGLAEWMSYYSVAKIGGKDRFGNGYPTRWVLKLNKYALVMKFVKSLGHTLKDIPVVFFPPEAMLSRVAAIEARRNTKASAARVRQHASQPLPPAKPLLALYQVAENEAMKDIERPLMTR